MCKKRKKNKKKKKPKKLSQFLKSHISGTLEAISLKFGMWSAEGGGSVHSKNRLVSSRQHRATEVRKFRFLPSCQYTHGCCAPASWATRHTTVYLDYETRYILNFIYLSFTVSFSHNTLVGSPIILVKRLRMQQSLNCSRNSLSKFLCTPLIYCMKDHATTISTYLFTTVILQDSHNKLLNF